MPNWNDDDDDDDGEEVVTPGAASNASSQPKATGYANQNNAPASSNIWNDDTLFLSTQFSNDEITEPPGVSTGARRRDPKPENRKPRNNFSKDNEYPHQTNRRRRQQLFKSKNRDIIFVPSNLTGLIIGRRGYKINEIEHTADVFIQVGGNDGIYSDFIIFGDRDAIKTADTMIKNILINVVNPNSDRQIAEQLGLDEAEIDCKVLCEQYKKYRDEQFAKLPPIIKDFYIEDPVVAAMSPKVVNNWRTENYDMQIQMRDGSDTQKKVPNPVLSFEQIFTNYPKILQELSKQGYIKPYPVQSQALPILLKGEDLICVAPNGTGKTLSVLLSALIHVDGQPIPKKDRNGPIVLIMVAKCRMVYEIQQELLKLAPHGMRAVCVYKEGDRNAQIKIISRGVDIVIATPTRLNDLAMSGHIGLINFTFIALLEIDNLIDFGYDAQIRKTMYNMRPGKQMIITSSNFTIGVRLFALSFMKDAIKLSLGVLSDLEKEDKVVTQEVRFIDEKEKIHLIIQFLINMNPIDKAVVFCATKDTTARISINLTTRGIRHRYIHRDLAAIDREIALQDVSKGDINILLATEVACREINVYDLTHVINLDYPGQIEEYIDRLDRTGRAGRPGIALSCITKNDWAHARDLILVLEETKQVIPDELEQLARKFEALSIAGRGPAGRRRDRGVRGQMRFLENRFPE